MSIFLTLSHFSPEFINSFSSRNKNGSLSRKKIRFFIGHNETTQQNKQVIKHHFPRKVWVEKFQCELFCLREKFHWFPDNSLGGVGIFGTRSWNVPLFTDVVKAFPKWNDQSGSFLFSTKFSSKIYSAGKKQTQFRFVFLHNFDEWQHREGNVYSHKR